MSRFILTRSCFIEFWSGLCYSPNIAISTSGSLATRTKWSWE